MNRRSLFKLLAGAATACALEWGGVVEKVWEARKTRVIVNPEYVNARYEDVVIFSQRTIWRYDRSVSPAPKGDYEPMPKRYNNEDGKWVEVPFYKEVEDI